MEDRKFPALSETTKPKQQHSPCWCWRKFLCQFGHKCPHRLFLTGLDKAFLLHFSGCFSSLAIKLQYTLVWTSSLKVFEVCWVRKRPSICHFSMTKLPCCLLGTNPAANTALSQSTEIKHPVKIKSPTVDPSSHMCLIICCSRTW